jgi:4-amino-4-deoxy-L-arabinose transferase-like glycosyltransferase
MELVEAHALLLTWQRPTALRDLFMMVRQATTSRRPVLYGAGLLILIVLGGTLLRFAGLGNESIWLDETTSILIARMDLPSVVAWTAADIHPPLYYFALHFWLGFGESEFAVRALSAMFGVWTIVIVYALARELFDSDIGLLSALLLALSPMHIWYSQEARMYPMVTALSLLSSYLLVLALRSSAEPMAGHSTGLRSRQTRYWLGYLLFSVLALYTHYYALFVLLFQNLFIVYWLWSRTLRGMKYPVPAAGSSASPARAGWSIGPAQNAGRGSGPAHPANPAGRSSGDAGPNSGLWRKWLLTELGIALLFLPWVPVVYHQVRGGGGVWVEKAIGRPGVRALLDTWLQFSIGLERHMYPQDLRRVAYALFAVCILAVTAKLLSWPRRGLASLLQMRIRGLAPAPPGPDAATASGSLSDERLPPDTYRIGLLFCVLYVVVPLLAAWLLSQIKPMYADRYLLPFVPPYCILVACGLRAFKWHWLRWVIVLFLTLTLLLGNWNAWRIPQREDWRWASSYVLARAQPGDVVLFLPRWLAKPFDYYARGRLALSMDLPVPVTAQSAQDVATDTAQRYQRVWLVWQRGHYSDPDGVVKQVFDARFRFVEEVEFPGVGSLVLYSLEPAGKGPG